VIVPRVESGTLRVLSTYKMPAAWEHLSAKYAQVGLRHSETGRVRWDGEGGWEKEYSWLLLSSFSPH
jgi:hypothetical protein